ncbi:MAG: DsbA family protein [Myxococcota bacterium]
MASLLAVTSLAPACRTETEKEAHPRVKLEGDRHQVELFDDDQALGSDNPLVTIVLFSDYACPPCSRTWQVMDNLVEDYGADLRVVFRSYTVQALPGSERAAEAAFAAGAQGKFWEMHRRLSAQGSDFERPTLRAHAEALSLDVDRFMDDLDTGAHSGPRIRHRRQAKSLGVVGLPAMFINGKYLAGFQDEPTWHGIIDQQIAEARTVLEQGTPRAGLYDKLMEGATTRRVGGAPGEQELREKLAGQAASVVDPRRLVAPDGSRRYAIRVGDAPATGDATAPVELVMFFDFRCPYCRRAWKQEIGVLVRSQPQGVRLAIRQLPLEIHPTATGAAQAVLAAGRQSRFWGMFDRLVEHDGTLGRSNFVDYAKELGLDEARFLADLSDPAIAKQVEADLDLANKVGVTGTPGFFVNGRYVNGFTPGVVTAMVEEEQVAAQTLIDAGTPPDKVVDELMKDAVPASEFPNR